MPEITYPLCSGGCVRSVARCPAASSILHTMDFSPTAEESLAPLSELFKKSFLLFRMPNDKRLLRTFSLQIRLADAGKSERSKKFYANDSPVHIEFFCFRSLGTIPYFHTAALYFYSKDLFLPRTGIVVLEHQHHRRYGAVSRKRARFGGALEERHRYRVCLLYTSPSPRD